MAVLKEINPMVEYGSTKFTPAEQQYMKEKISEYEQKVRMEDLNAAIQYQIGELNEKLGR
jgi:hypothetical protein